MKSRVIAEEMVHIARELVGGGRRIDPRHLTAMGNLTQRNAHTEALIYFYSRVLGEVEVVKALKAMNVLSDYFGSMPHELGDLRYKMFYKPAMEAVKRIFSEEDAIAIINCF